ncbi:hypothetical protein [Pseudomonas mediterranea]|uniref:hypothetical protein n=1 Tax=Pseudomonas mediterranea TaxID=183795 RepID=UPI0006D88D8A|nr:hypothetical protein [Pseudomonas mediterranea]
MSENLIPVADVTDEAKEQAAFEAAHAQAVEHTMGALATLRPFVFVDLAEAGTQVTVLADRRGLEFATMTLLTALGADLLGPSVDHLPHSLGNNLKMAAGLSHIQRQLQAITAPHTPATDAAAGTQH